MKLSNAYSIFFETPKFRKQAPYILSVMFFCYGLLLRSQTSVQNFGTTASTNCSCSGGSTTFIPAPTGSGTTYARTGAGGSPVINLVTTPNPLGSSGAYVRASASSSGSVTKLSPAVNFTGTKSFYAKFKVLLGDAAGGSSATDGEWRFFLGSGAMYTDNNDFTGAQVFAGFRFTFGASGALTLNNRNGSNWNTTGLGVSAFDQGTFYSIELIGNNQSSGTISYSYNGISQTVAINKYDLYINGVIIGDDIAVAQQANNTNINAATFIGEASTGNAANMLIDDFSISSSIPSALGGMTNPAAYNLASGSYSFNNWPVTSAIGTYPPNMIFHYGDVGQTDPALAQVNATQDYVYGYNYTSQSRITAKGSNGIAFINTNPGHVSGTSGNVGEAVLALNTSCRNNIQVSWTAGTTALNSRVYKLRAQYRVGTTGSYSDLPNTSLNQIEYTSSANTVTNFGPVTLPASCENQPVVQVRWVYYWSSGASSARDEINLTNISISSTSSVPGVYSVTGGGSYCSGGAGVAIGLGNSSSGVNYQLYRGSTAIGSPVAGTGSLISFGNQTIAGTYTVLATNAVSSCTAVMTGSAVVVIKPLPSVSAVSDQAMCGGKAVSAITFSSTPPGATFLWTNTNTSIGLASAGTGSIAAFISPVLTSPPDQTGNIAVIASLNGCFGTQITFNITIKGPQTNSDWTGNVSSSWSNPDNWSNCVCGMATNASIPAVPGPGFNPVIDTNAYVNDLTLDSAAVLSFQNSEVLKVYGNWLNNGTLNAQHGNVAFVGTNPQSIGGNAEPTFYDLTLDNTSGAVLYQGLTIAGTLQLDNGVLDENGQVLTLQATAAGSARIGAISASADLQGMVNIQQYAPSGYTGWALLGTPLTSPLTMADWNDNFVITCASCPDGSSVAGSPFTSVYSYDETASGTYDASLKYVAINSISNPILPGAAYWAYIGTSYPSTPGITFDAIGDVAKSSCLTCTSPVVLNLSYTDHGSPADDGWNLISNPLPSPVSWTAFLNNNPMVDDAIYAYNADANGGAGGFVSCVNNVSSQLSGGISDTIPMCQGFYVHATGAATLTAGESIKVKANPAFLKTAQGNSAAKPLVRLMMNGASGSSDATVFYFENGATPYFDTHFDAYKLIYDASIPYVASYSDTSLTAISGLPDLAVSSVVRVMAITPVSNTYTFSISTEHFPNDVCVNLYDAYTGITTNLLTSSYACILYDTTTLSRFTMRFSTTPLVANATVVQPDCFHPHQGTITVAATGAGPWDYTWKDAGQAVIRTSFQKYTADTLNSYNGGDYTIQIHTSGSCDRFTQNIHINPVVIPLSQFTANPDTVYLISENGTIQFNNISQDSDAYWWDFGDASTGTMQSPSHSYAGAGIYTVLLISSSSSMCTDTSSLQVFVINDLPTGTGPAGAGKSVVLKSEKDGSYTIAYDLLQPAQIRYVLTSPAGVTLMKEYCPQAGSGTVHVDLSAFASGLYVFQVFTGDQLLKTFRLVKD